MSWSWPPSRKIPSSSRASRGCGAVGRRAVLRRDRLRATLGRRLSPAARRRAGCSDDGDRRDPRPRRRHRRHRLEHRASARPAALPDRLREVGFRDPEPPWEPVVAAMVLATEPPIADDVEIRRIETFDDHLAGLAIMLAADSLDPRRWQRSGHWRGRRSTAACGAVGCSGSLSSTGRRCRSRWRSGARQACSLQAVPPCPRRGGVVATGHSYGRGGTRPRSSGFRGSRCRRSTDRRLRSCAGSDSSRLPRSTR